MQALDCQSHASDEAASTHRHDNCVNVRHLLYDLQPQRALTSNNVRVVVPDTQQSKRMYS